MLRGHFGSRSRRRERASNVYCIECVERILYPSNIYIRFYIEVDVLFNGKMFIRCLADFQSHIIPNP